MLSGNERSSILPLMSDRGNGTKVVVSTSCENSGMVRGSICGII